MRTVGAPPTAGPRTVIERTSPTDLMQLTCEVPGSPMQVAAVLVLGAATAVDLTAVRDVIGRRLSSVLRLRQRLVRAPLGAGRPVWLDDPDFDVGRHVDAVACPSPGDKTAMLGVAADVVIHPLPIDRALWPATLVTDMAYGRAALIVMLHHVLADGIGGLAVLARLVDGAPTASEPEFPGHRPGRRALFLDASGARLRALTASTGGNSPYPRPPATTSTKQPRPTNTRGIPEVTAGGSVSR
ncbi:wax ester/triacylglycerol synthase domain-containing protein [Micromonospora sp. NPDC049282]|uniref:wax ester/triacylglycerol synthase domain-containing protein n=1 Tax=Micromonospora sp. NPDC049282 TaxID=3364269 RepID=UPI003718BB22